jgi:hypothetical protein
MPGVGARPRPITNRRLRNRISVPLRIGDGEVALVQSPVLIEEAVIRSDQDVGEIGRGQLTNELGQILDRVLCGFRQLVLGLQLVADGVDTVVVDIDDVVIAEERLAVFGAHIHHLFGLHGLWRCLLRDRLRAIFSRAASPLVFSPRQRRMSPLPSSAMASVAVRQECRHAELGIAGQGADHGFSSASKRSRREYGAGIPLPTSKRSASEMITATF